MALPALPGQIDLRVAKIRVLDPQSVSFKFSEIVGVDGYGPTLKTLTIFNPEVTYALFAVRYSVSASGNMWGQTMIQVGFTDLPAGVGGTASLGTSMLDSLISGQFGASESGFMNWTPYAWYLPVGKTVYLSSSTNLYTGNAVRGSVQLFISEIFEQG